ncbi:MAG: glutathione S-transferase family protein [Candidatus Binataceae bacterium]
MSTTKLITMYLSPWSERVRWAFKFKGLPYEKENYEAGVDEKKIKTLTGQAMVPVLLTGGRVIPDSSAILEWLEDSRPEPALLPRSERDRALVTLWEELALGVIGPHGRTLITGRLLRINDPKAQSSGKYFAEKYGHSPYAEEQARLTLRRILLSIKRTLSGRRYLVGNAFTRADLTTAAMLMLLRAAPDEFFVFPPQIRPIYMDPLGEDSEFSAVFAWRDEMYRSHRGEVVTP